MTYNKIELINVKPIQPTIIEAEIKGFMQFGSIKDETGDISDEVNRIQEIINEEIKKAMPIVAEKLGLALDAAMMSAIWNWSDGSRDIIDTGELMRSRNIAIQDNKLIISYNVPYFGIVHFGGYVAPYGNSKTKKMYLPARPWVTAVIYGGAVPAFDFEAAYREALAAIM